MARPTKLTTELTQLIAQMLRAGNHVETACEAAGISTSTHYDWMLRGDPDGKRAADRPHRTYRAAIDRAQAEGEARMVTLIANAAAKGSWKAAAWLLERQWPGHWAPGTAREAPAQAPATAEGPVADVVSIADRRRLASAGDPHGGF